LAEIEANFHRYGVRLLLGVRLLPGVRAPVFIAAGVVRLPLHRFLLADGIYAIPGVSVLFVLAYWFTDSVVQIVHNFERQIGSMRHYFVIGGIAALAAWLTYEFWQRRKVTGDPKEVPHIVDKIIHPHESADKAGKGAEVTEQMDQEKAKPV
jgi:membrane protein DedA with SNARE-associated domain